MPFRATEHLLAIAGCLQTTPLSAADGEAESESRKKKQLEAEVDLLVAERLKQVGDATSTSAKHIQLPRFFVKKPKTYAPDDDDDGGGDGDNEPHVTSLFTKATHEEVRRRQAALELDPDELERVWFALRDAAAEEAKKQPDGGDSRYVSYHAFATCRELLSEELGRERVNALLQAGPFLRFEADDSGRVPVLPLFHYVIRRVNQRTSRVKLSAYDEDHDGFLTESELESYLRDIIPTLKQLDGIAGTTFEDRHRTVCLRRLMFFHGNAGKVKISEIVTSKEHQSLLDLRIAPRMGRGGRPIGGANATNWYSEPGAKRVYQIFMSLDQDMDGLLAADELAMLGGGGMTTTFAKRVLAAIAAPTNIRNQGRKLRNRKSSSSGMKMDFNNFVTFLCAWDNKSNRKACEYFFRVLDASECGYFRVEDFHYFFVEVRRRWIELGNYTELRSEDVCDEVFDMLSKVPQAANIDPDYEVRAVAARASRQPRDPFDVMTGVSCKEFVASGMGDTVVEIVSDVNSFWRYDNRESLGHDDEDDYDDYGETASQGGDGGGGGVYLDDDDDDDDDDEGEDDDF